MGLTAIPSPDQLYSDAGHPQGAIRFTEPDVVREWEHYIKSLYESGEDIASYFERVVAHLPAPTSVNSADQTPRPDTGQAT